MRQRLLSAALVGDILDLRREYNVPGLAIGVVAGPSQGRKDWAEDIILDGISKGDGAPFANDTIWPMASVSKPFAYICVGILIDRKTIVPSTGEHLSWHTKIKDVLGDAWRTQDATTNDEATLQDAAGMRCGIPPHTYSLCAEYPYQLLHRLRHLKQGRSFRERFQYAGENPASMCCIVEILSGKNYPQFIEENIFKPLGLTSTASDTSKLRASGRLCDGFFRKGANPDLPGHEGWGQPRNIGWCTGEDNGGLSQGQTGLVTCMKDAVVLLREMLDPTILPSSWTTHRHRPISVLTPGEFPPMYFTWSPGVYSAGYAYGHYQMTYRGYEVLFTPGLHFGQSNYMVYLPDAKIGCWIEVNEDGPGSQLISEAAAKIFEELLGLEPFQSTTPSFLVEPITPPRVDIPLGGLVMPPPLDSQESERILLSPSGYFDPGHYMLVFKTFDMTANSPLVEIIKDASRGSPSRETLTRVINPPPETKFYIANVDFDFISQLLLISTDQPGMYEWIAIKTMPLLDGNAPGELGSRPLPPPGKLVLTRRGFGLFEGWMDRTGLTSRRVPEGWQEDWRKVQVGAEAWFDRL